MFDLKISIPAIPECQLSSAFCFVSVLHFALVLGLNMVVFLGVLWRWGCSIMFPLMREHRGLYEVLFI